MSPTPEIFAPASDQPVRITVPGSGYELREELNRKTFETLDWLVLGVDCGRITQDQFSVAIDAMFMALSGLVESPFVEIVTEAQKQCSDGKFKVKRLFHHPDSAEIVRLSWAPGESAIYAMKLVMGQAVGGKQTELNNSKAAFAAFGRMSDALAEKGWIEL